MARAHKNKTLATFLAAVFGGLGLHRFYLFSKPERWGLVHLATVPLSLALLAAGIEANRLFLAAPFVLSVLAGFLEALVIGLTPDEKWDARFNAASGRSSDSGWTVVLLLIATMAGGATSVIWVMARTFDLLLTGGSYG